ncbi:putative RING finger protein [Yarrowia sp. B02]|nr:putative RING finger protein [Yarrowia sp. B02]
MSNYEQDHNITGEASNGPTDQDGNHPRNTLGANLQQFLDVERDRDRRAGVSDSNPGPDYVPAFERAIRQLDRNEIIDFFVQFIDGLDLQTGEAPKPKGLGQEYLDTLDRIPKKQLKESDSCAICSTPYLEDEYPLVVRLPCNRKHHFDLECIAPWLKLNATCPMCRKDLAAKAEIEPDSEEEFDDTYG